MEIVRLEPRLVMLAFPVGQAYLWHGPGGLTLIDTSLPGSGPQIAGAIEELGYRRRDLRRLLLTHHHEDHVGSAAEVAAWGDVEVVAHHLDAPVIRGEADGPPPVLSGWERELFDQVQAGMTHDEVAPVRVDREAGDGDEIDLGGGVRAVCVAVPGHTPGSVAYHLPEARVLFTGDTIARGPDGNVMLGVFNADPDLAAASFRRQAGLDVDIACFGHGAPVTERATAALRAAQPR
ncbi:MBL fold metallo-hydrolase [Actinoplanes aureus]|uniref:MBL fold metallo-hydrolase n=1 Tax=Actinoplanes aureus TaxID=2792083 RepID=A0A931FX93_9ACTN|nr:MBL fold metallo-hydrolase [Actinoplanes aureus]MBG0562230.1 MBL fold metallo-hydrolase [Actinoplanes aureus]